MITSNYLGGQGGGEVQAMQTGLALPVCLHSPDSAPLCNLCLGKLQQYWCQEGGSAPLVHVTELNATGVLFHTLKTKILGLREGIFPVAARTVTMLAECKLALLDLQKQNPERKSITKDSEQITSCLFFFFLFTSGKIPFQLQM